MLAVTLVIACVALGARCTAAEAAAVTTCDPATLAGCATGLTCAKKDDHYAQCVNCTTEAFQKSCLFLDATLVRAAEAACGAACKEYRHVDRCEPDTLEGCPAGLECAKKDEHWAQCVNCTAEQFHMDCPYYWYAELMHAADVACNQTCAGGRGSQCVTIPCAEGLSCVQSSETWSQCVDCGAKAFQQDCGFWSSELVAAAEKACDAKCDAAKRRLLL